MHECEISSHDSKTQIRVVCGVFFLLFFCLITYFQSTQMKLHEGLTVTESHVAYTEQGC